MSSPTIQQVPLDPRYSVNPNDNTSSVNMSSTESDTPKIENSAAIPVVDTSSKNSDEPSPVVKLPSKPRASENLSNAFSRRTSVPNANATSSVYSEESEEKPAWMKDSSTNKYDKYGARPVHVPNARGKRDSRDTLDRYSKYDIGSSDNRLKLREGEAGRGYEDSEESHRNSKRTYEQDPPSSAPYNNLIAANPASFQENQQIKRYQTFQSHINNRSAKDQNSIVRTHYNQRAHQLKTQGARTDSPIIKLRNFNNAIKYILLGNFALTKKKEPSARDTVILDLCCGKGGDLNKCEFIGVDQYVGIDISDASVKEAFSRYYRSKAKFVPRHAHENRDTRKLHFEACFATGDCFAYSVPDILEPSFPGIIDKVFPADCVLIQFALHYAFETEEKVDKLLTNVTKSLRSGGTFIGTIPSSDFIRKKIVNHEFVPTEDNKVRFGNDLYSVTFQKEPPSDGVFRPPFGNKYMFSLKDAIDDVPEYVVPFETLRAKCEEFGLVLKYKKNFIDIFNEEIPKYFSKLNKKLIDGMKRSDGKYGVEGSEKEATAFYLGFVFEKL